MIIYGSLYPWKFAAGDPVTALAHAFQTPPINRFLVRDLIVNIAMYVPLGAVGHLVFRRDGRLPAIVIPIALGMLISIAVEIAQVYTPLRTPSATDVLFNGVGATAGVAIASLLHGTRKSSFPVRLHGDRTAAALLCCAAAYLLFPFFPALSRTIVLQKLGVLAASTMFSVLPLISAVVTWFVSGRLLSAVKASSPVAVLVFSVLAIPAQLFVLGRQPVLSMLLGAIAGSIIFAVCGRWRTAAGAAATLTLTLLILQGFSPFHWQEAANPFTWTPFGGVLAADWQRGILLLIEKTFYYGIALWTLTRAGVRFSTAMTALTAIAAIAEAAQVYLPGRTPEVTDPLLVVLIGFTFRVLENSTIASGRSNG